MKIIYCIDEGFGIKGFNLLMVLTDESDEVFMDIMDALRSFNPVKYRDKIRSNELIVKRISQLLEMADPFDKPALKQFSNWFLEDPCISP